MLNFIKSLLSNRFGIILATLNLCYLIYLYHNFSGFWALPKKMIICMNFPALLSAGLTSKILYLFFPTVSHSSLMYFIFPAFVVLQWLFIAWVAKTLARKFSRIKW